jgi:putative sterol carrier protein
MTTAVDSCQAWFDTIENRFIASEANGVDAKYSYQITGNGGGDWTLTVKNGGYTVADGIADDANVTYTIEADDYVRLVNGELNGVKAVMTRKLKVKGSIVLAKKMNKFLPPGQA